MRIDMNNIDQYIQVLFEESQEHAGFGDDPLSKHAYAMGVLKVKLLLLLSEHDSMVDIAKKDIYKKLEITVD